MSEIVAIGHVGIQVHDVGCSIAFYRDTLGLKHVVEGDYFNAFEVGDVHLFIVPGEPSEAQFDFTSDDVDDFHARLIKAGVACSELKDNEEAGHRLFTFTDPDGHEITVYSAHEPNMPAVA